MCDVKGKQLKETALDAIFDGSGETSIPQEIHAHQIIKNVSSVHDIEKYLCKDMQLMKQ